MDEIEEPQLKKQGFPKKSFIFLAISFFLALPVTIVLLQRSQDVRQQANENVTIEKSYDQAIQEGKLKPAGKIIEISLMYDKSNALRPLMLKKVQRKNGYAPKILNETNGYKVILLNATNEKIYDTGFLLPNEIRIEDFTAEDTDEIREQANDIVLTKTEFIVTIPFLATATEVRITTSQGIPLVAKSLKNIPTINNKPAFHMFKGDDILRSQPKSGVSNQKGWIKNAFAETKHYIAQTIPSVYPSRAPTPSFIPPPTLTPSFYISPTFGPTYPPKPTVTPGPTITQPPTLTPIPPDEYLDIAFIGDNYKTTADIEKFQQIVKEGIEKLLYFEPFRTRASQLRFHRIDNITADLGCLSNGTGYCTTLKVIEEVNNAAVPYDKIYVFVNGNIRGYAWGVGGIYGAGPHSTTGDSIFVHELGHMLGLWDEYQTILSNGFIENRIYANCYAGIPPTIQWQLVTGEKDYSANCTYPNYYSSSIASIMNFHTSSRGFNEISREIINKTIDGFSGRYMYTDIVPPTIRFASLTNGSVYGIENDNIPEVLPITSDNNRVERVQLWLDGKLHMTSYETPNFNTLPVYVFDYPDNSTHILQFMAYDAAGNKGESEVISVTFSHARPSLIPTPISEGNLLKNPDFERDTNQDDKPDDWSKNTHANLTTLLSHGDEHSLLHAATNNASYGISQKVDGITPGTSYRFSGWTNIPNTNDTFSYKIAIKWQDSNGKVIGTDTADSYTKQTNGWVESYGRYIAPDGASSVVIRMIVKSLNAKIYADEFSFRKVQ